VSDQTSLSEHRNARSFASRWVVIYFGVLLVLTSMAFAPDAITAGMLLFILPGLILLASGTLLFYSIALLPAYLINRHLGKRLLAAAVAVFSIAAAAALPHYIDEYRLYRLIASDRSGPPTSLKPRSFELPYRDEDIYWTTWRGQPLIRPPPACADLCQQLLFKGNVDQVLIRGDMSKDPLANGTIVITGGKAYLLSGRSPRVIRPGDLSHDTSAQEIPVERTQNPAKFFKPGVRRFRVEQRETCPAVLSIIEYEFAHEAAGGRCLIEDIVEGADADVVLSIAEAPAQPPAYRTDPCQAVELRRIQKGPTTITIAERRGDRLVPVEIKTTLMARYAAMPFYFSVTPHGGGEIPHLCLGAATEPFPRRYADPYEMIARRYGLPIARTSASDRPPRLP
jgi:hypothetical protein